MVGHVPSRPTLLVHCDLDEATAARTAVAVELAHRTEARLIGVAAGVAKRIPGGPRLAGPLVAVAEESLREALELAADDFKTRAAQAEHSDFCSAVKPAEVFLAEQAVTADLVIVGPQGCGESSSPLPLDTAMLVMCSGRPVLIAPVGLDRLDLRRVVVAWKNTRETRRVLLDCLPWL